MLPGNHDLNQQSTDESISCYMDEYGYDCFCFHLNNSCFIGLNTPIIFANREEKEKKQLVWLEKNLENFRNVIIVSFWTLSFLCERA